MAVRFAHRACLSSFVVCCVRPAWDDAPSYVPSCAPACVEFARRAARLMHVVVVRAVVFCQMLWRWLLRRDCLGSRIRVRLHSRGSHHGTYSYVSICVRCIGSVIVRRRRLYLPSASEMIVPLA